MKNLTRHLKWYVPGLILGAIAGYIYWYYWGCNGTCLITSSPWRSMIYFSVMGAVANSMFKPTKKDDHATQNQSPKH